MPAWYREFPSLIHHPLLWQGGFFSVSWYAASYALSFFLCGWIGWRMLKRDGIKFSPEQRLDLLIAVLAGVLVGGRLGFVALYQPAYFMAHPLQIISPVNPVTGAWLGIAGMSFHGGLIGVGLGLWWFARKHDMNRWYLADLGALLAPIGIFFGRIANFVNGELYGRVTNSPFGMYFPWADIASFPENPLNKKVISGEQLFLRHPSQLYEGLGEGILLGLFLWYVERRWPLGSGAVAAFFLFGYGAIRFGIEFVREPDIPPGLFWNDTLSLGQILCLAMIFCGYIVWRESKKSAILKKS